MQVADVLYVRASETEVVQVVAIKFSRQRLQGHVELLDRFAREYFMWAHEKKSPVVPGPWKDIVAGHLSMWLALKAVIDQRDEKSCKAMAAEHADLFQEQDGRISLRPGRVDAAMRCWQQQPRAACWPVKVIKFIAQVRVPHCMRYSRACTSGAVLMPPR